MPPRRSIPTRRGSNDYAESFKAWLDRVWVNGLSIVIVKLSGGRPKKIAMYLEPFSEDAISDHGPGRYRVTLIRHLPQKSIVASRHVHIPYPE